jgi:MoxR-like ATPase
MSVETESKSIAERIVENVKKVIVGKESTVRLGVIALMCRGHVLVEDVPGVGKTMLAKSLARSTGCSFSRIQFTPDLLPSDVTGTLIYNQKTFEFEFRQGPIHAQVVLADEINRATPKTQSALLEAMEEDQVTVDGVTHPLPTPFMVIATQNPIEYEGTFPLPEAQLDRFLLRIRLGYPTFEEEISIIESQQLSHPFDSLEPVATPAEVMAIREEARKIYVDPLVKQYIVSLAESTREHRDVALGASPRASLALQRTGQALALLQGRDYVLPDDIKELAEPVIAHRLVLTAAARMQGIDGPRVVQQLTDAVEVPGAIAGDRVAGGS